MLLGSIDICCRPGVMKESTGTDARSTAHDIIIVHICEMLACNTCDAGFLLAVASYVPYV